MLNTFRCFGKLPADANIDELVASVFSVFPVGEKAAGVFICDVMGHGVRSALITSMIRALVEEQAGVTTDPGELLTRVNHALAEILRQARTTMFATCFYLVADVDNAKLRFANAGHPCAFRIRQGSPPAEKLQGNGRVGPAMGIFPSATYQTATHPIAKAISSYSSQTDCLKRKIKMGTPLASSNSMRL